MSKKPEHHAGHMEDAQKLAFFFFNSLITNHGSSRGMSWASGSPTGLAKKFI